VHPLFGDDEDRWYFLGLLGTVTREIGWRCLAFCLMGTHYHLVLEERDVPLSRGMHLLNGRYAVAVNARYGRSGHLFRSRFSDTSIDSESHLLSALRYVALNPVDAGLSTSPEEWPWSSYGQLIGVARGWSFMSTAWTLSLFAPHRSASARSRSCGSSWSRCQAPE